ncbi:MAG: hypothetical protein CM1200mP35_04230 [Chloroflexota bacterium]|nr:MAG: hypothetical protein CM1200mP35_04230 [Chloroflexota bacterium]
MVIINSHPESNSRNNLYIANVCILLFIMLGFDQGINNGSVTALHVMDSVFSFNASTFRCQLFKIVFVAKVGKKSYTPSASYVNHLQAFPHHFSIGLPWVGLCPEAKATFFNYKNSLK